MRPCSFVRCNSLPTSEYQAQAHSEKLALSLSLEKKTEAGERSKSKKTKQLHLEDKVMHLVLDGAVSGAPKMIAAMTGTTQALATLERMSTRCVRDHATQSVLIMIMGANQVVSFNLLF